MKKAKRNKKVTSVSLEPKVHEMATELAERENRTFSNLIESLIIDKLKEK